MTALKNTELVEIIHPHQPPWNPPEPPNSHWKAAIKQPDFLQSISMFIGPSQKTCCISTTYAILSLFNFFYSLSVLRIKDCPNPWQYCTIVHLLLSGNNDSAQTVFLKSFTLVFILLTLIHHSLSKIYVYLFFYTFQGQSCQIVKSRIPTKHVLIIS